MNAAIFSNDVEVATKSRSYFVTTILAYRWGRGRNQIEIYVGAAFIALRDDERKAIFAEKEQFTTTWARLSHHGRLS